MFTVARNVLSTKRERHSKRKIERNEKGGRRGKEIEGKGE